MDLLDFVIVAALAGFSYSGWRRGVTWVGPSFAGLAIGVVVGAIVAPMAARWMAAGSNLLPFVTSLMFFVCVFLFQGVGTALGFRFRSATLRTRFARWDSVLGAGVTLMGVLATTWYIGLTFSQSPWSEFDTQINQSFIVRKLVGLAPHPPAVLAKIQAAISGNDLPHPFAGLNPLGLPDVTVPATADSPQIQQVAANTARVISSSPACVGAEAGSGFAVATDYLITNAHVVAGGTRFEVNSPDGTVHDNVSVVFFDPQVDVAILHVPHLGLKPLHLLSGDPASGTNSAVIGYPNGGVEQIFPAAVRGVLPESEGWNIYTSETVTRDIVVISGRVLQGDSGGPLVNDNGTVIGLVFATSTSKPDQEGYALSTSEIGNAIRAGTNATQLVSTKSCLGG